MDNILFQSYKIEERSYVSFIKREIHNLVSTAFDSYRTGEIDIVVSEMCSNLIKHAQSGELLYRLSRDGDQPVFEVICLDNAQGIKDVVYSSIDGNSSKGTLGQGLGAIARLSNVSQIYSMPEWGTIVYCKFYSSIEYKIPRETISIRCINVAKPGEQVSGDGIAYKLMKNKTLIFVGDGLGHGKFAKEAVDAAIYAFNQSMSADPSELIREVNDHVKKTRGLVATVAILDHDRKRWEICGVGNIATRVQRGLEYKNYICNNGVVGMNLPGRLENTILEMEKYQFVIFCSDGIKTNWDISRYPSILKYDPMIMACAIYKDNARKTDDMTVLIAKTK